MDPASLGSSGPKKHDNGGRASALDGDGAGRGKSGASAQGANACARTCPQSNAQSIIDKESSTGSASSDHVDGLAITKAESEMRRFPYAARGPGNKPAAAVGAQNTKIPKQKKNLQPMQGQKPGEIVTPLPPHGQMPQSTQGQASQPAQEQIPQPTQERALAARPRQGQTSQLSREQTPQSPEQQTPQTTGGQEPPANGPKRRPRRAPATTATTATTAVPKR